MFFSAYLFALVLGGVLLGSSIVMGGQAEGDAGDAGDAASPHVDAHVGDLVHVAKEPLARRRVRPLLGAALSMRFWTFFSAFFGLTGVVLEGLGLVTAITALVVALGMGLTCGLGATSLFRHLSANTTGVAARSRDYIGRGGRVLVTIRPGGLGKIRLEIHGTTVDVLATTDGAPIEAGEGAMIIEMRDTTAIVIRQGQLAGES